MRDDDRGGVGQTALVRIVNGGQFSHSLHFHGSHVQVLTINGVRQNSPYKQIDVINVPRSAPLVRPKDAAGNWLNRITHPATAYDYVQNDVFSTVEPAYHTSTGDSTVFADYNPRYFLINGNEGRSASAPASSLSTARNSRVALRLIGLHSTNGTFSIRDGAGNAKPFTVYVQDGRAYAAPETKTSLDISPGQRFDIVFTTSPRPGRGTHR